MIKQRIALTILILALALAAFGCGGTSQPAGQAGGDQAKTTGASATAVSYPLTVKDDSGQEVTVSKKPERIVSLVPSTTEIAFALGLGDKVVGVSDLDDYPDAVKTKEKIGGLEVNTEKVLSLHPDLVLATAEMTAKAVSSLRKLGLTVVAVEPKSIDGVYDSIRLIGRVTGASAEAENVIARMKQEQEQVRAAVRKLKPEERPKVWLELDEHLYTAGGGTIIDEMIREAGGINIAGQTPGWPQMSAENVIQSKPDVILVNYSYIPDAVDRVAKRPGWQSVPAVIHHRVYQLDEDIVSRPGPRITQGLLQIAKFLHPDAF